jgi:hypothetical protein
VNSSAKEIISPFERLLADLTASGVDYAVVGGVAVIANGYLRLTEDLDILVSDSPDNLTKLLEVLSRFGEGFARELKPEDFPRQEGSIRIMEEFDLDIFILLRGRVLDDFRPALRRCVLDSCSFQHLAPEHLVQIKKGSWREKDRLDVAAMNEIIERERKAK